MEGIKLSYKPWALLVLAFFYLIEPITKIVFYSFYWGVNPVQFISAELQAGTLIESFEFFLLFPIAGVALFAVKKWSFPLFIAVQLWVVVLNIPYLSELYQTNQVWLFAFFVVFSLLNIAAVGFLLLPAVRIAYLDPKIRWWEAKPRYSKLIKGVIDNKNIAEIRNISESGVFVTTEKNLQINTDVMLNFKLAAESGFSDEYMFIFKAHVVHKFTVDGQEGYGTQFVETSASDKRHIRKMIKSLEKSNCQRRPPRRGFSDLIKWLVNLIKTGEGLVESNKVATH